MKRRVVLLLTLPLVAVLAIWYVRWRAAQLEPVEEPLVERSAPPIRRIPPPPQAALVTVPPPVFEIAPMRMPRIQPVAPARMEIPIQDGATIDFSIGAPVIRSSGRDAEALDRALIEMAEATKNLSFGPPQKQSSGGKQ